jgi:hypothetical protein
MGGQKNKKSSASEKSGQSVTDPLKSEQLLAKQRQYQLNQFCNWVMENNAFIVADKISPMEIVASNGMLEYPFEPAGGLNIDDWPLLRDLCDDDFLKNEIIKAVLENQLFRSYPLVASQSAIAELENAIIELDLGELWSVVEGLPFEDVVAFLREQATAIANVLKESQRKRKRDLDLEARREASMLRLEQLVQIVDRPPKGKPGRKIKRDALARFAIVRRKRKPQPTWEDIAVEWNLNHSEDEVDAGIVRSAERNFLRRQKSNRSKSKK